MQVFDRNLHCDECLSTEELIRALASCSEFDGIPLIAAGGITTGYDICGALEWGASAVQMGTAFVACPESNASPNHRSLLANPSVAPTRFTSIISGRPARGFVDGWINRIGEGRLLPPQYPTAFDVAMNLAAEAKRHSDPLLEIMWAGAGAGRSRTLPAADLIATLAGELSESDSIAPTNNRHAVQ